MQVAASASGSFDVLEATGLRFDFVQSIADTFAEDQATVAVFVSRVIWLLNSDGYRAGSLITHSQLL